MFILPLYTLLNPSIIFGAKTKSILEDQIDGDIVWPKITKNRMIFYRAFRSNAIEKSSDGRTKIHYWKNGIVPYFFDFEEPKEKQNHVLEAMEEIQSKTCIKYKVSHIKSYFTKKFPYTCG